MTPGLSRVNEFRIEFVKFIFTSSCLNGIHKKYEIDRIFAKTVVENNANIWKSCKSGRLKV